MKRKESSYKLTKHTTSWEKVSPIGGIGFHTSSEYASDFVRVRLKTPNKVMSMQQVIRRTLKRRTCYYCVCLREKRVPKQAS